MSNRVDEVLEALVAIREAKIALQTAERMLGDKIRRDQKMFREIMDAVRESDEAQADHGSRSAPDAPPIPNTASLCNVAINHDPLFGIAQSGCHIPEDVIRHIDECGE